MVNWPYCEAKLVLPASTRRLMSCETYSFMNWMSSAFIFEAMTRVSVYLLMNRSRSGLLSLAKKALWNTLFLPIR